MKEAFVELLVTPTLMAIFSKDGDTASRARATLRSLAYLEPNVVMPPFLERAYNGLEAVNETHRTTAVLYAMSEVVLPLVSEDVWFGGQKHILPLLELCLPGIDLVCFSLSNNLNILAHGLRRMIRLKPWQLHPSCQMCYRQCPS